MDAESNKLSRGTKTLIVFGGLMLIVPPVALLQTAHNAFTETCKQQCYPVGMDYKVIPTGSSGLGGYPAICQCVAYTPKQWWQFWRNELPQKKFAIP